MTKEFHGCWLCLSHEAHPQHTGLLHLGFPRCMILVPDGCMYKIWELFENEVEVQWLDEDDQYTPNEQREVIKRMWQYFNAYIEEEQNIDKRIRREMEDGYEGGL